jgi:hypothetical protein
MQMNRHSDFVESSTRRLSYADEVELSSRYINGVESRSSSHLKEDNRYVYCTSCGRIFGSIDDFLFFFSCPLESYLAIKPKS